MDWNSVKTIAIVGLSPNEEKDSNKVAKYFLKKGHEIIPVNPNSNEILGFKCYPSLSSIPSEISNEIDMIDIFRRSEFVLSIIEEIIQNKNKFKNLKVIWMQEGVSDSIAFDLAQKNGYHVVMNSCAMVQHSNNSILEFKL
jgi:uncharacterized protein